jgi:hypothetical protein
MDAQRHSEDSHQGQWFSPKLMLVGRLHGTIDGRPWDLLASDQSLLLRLADLTSARKLHPLLVVLQQGVQSGRAPFRPPLFNGYHGAVRIKIGRLPAVRVPRVLWTRLLTSSLPTKSWQSPLA